MADNRPHLSIGNWLEKLELSVYEPLLKKYSGVEDILWMTERDLKNIGVKNGSHRARLSSSIAILKDKYEKMSRLNSPNFNGSNLAFSSSTLSRASISPIRNVDFERTQTGVRSWPSTRPTSTHSTKHSSPRSSMDGYPGTEATATELKRALERELSLDSSDLRSHAWYHGTILRQRAEELVSQEGDFLVRDCISQPGDFVITCKWKGLPLHFIIKKVILQPNTVYERIQYCFEKETFDTIPDFITYYVGSKCPLSESSGVIINRPVNRIMPLSYYESRYGVQCQIHYVARALEKIPTSPPFVNNNQFIPPDTSNLSLDQIVKPRNLLPTFEEVNITVPVQNSTDNKSNYSVTSNLTRVGSDPNLNLNAEKRTVEPRPNSGVFNSDCLASVSLNPEDKPPPKPSRVPSKRCSQRPLIVKRERKSSDDEVKKNLLNTIPIPGVSVAHPSFKRQISETRFSFLDRPSLSSGGSTPDMDSVSRQFTIPKIQTISSFEPQKFQSLLLAPENSPLEALVLSRVRHIILSCSPKILACHLTRMDLEIAQNFEDVDLGMGVTSGLEFFLLPQGEQMQKDLLERTESMKLLVAILLLTTPEEDNRVKLLNKLIEIAIETKRGLGNFYGFTAIMLGLTLPEILGLQSTWLALRHSHTENAFVFETKLRPAFKALHNAKSPDAPNTCFPYILSLILILQKYISVINCLSKESTSEDIADFYLPGTNTSDDYGLQLLADHLEMGRNISQQVLLFKKNGQMSLQDTKYEDVVLDVFRTEFHLRLLWGFRGCVVCHEDRHNIFKKVVLSLYQKCMSVNS